MLTRRDSLGGAIIFLWLVGLALLARRELFVAEPEQLLEAALPMVPGSAYYEVMSGDERGGWASASIDTCRSGSSVRVVMVIDALDSGAKRLAARARVSLTPGLRLTGFTFELGGDHGPYRESGKMSEDTVLQLITATGKARADTARMPVRRAVLWPTTVPLALALAARPKVDARTSTRSTTRRQARPKTFTSRWSPSRCSWFRTARSSMRRAARGSLRTRTRCADGGSIRRARRS